MKGPHKKNLRRLARGPEPPSIFAEKLFELLLQIPMPDEEFARCIERLKQDVRQRRQRAGDRAKFFSIKTHGGESLKRRQRCFLTKGDNQFQQCEAFLSRHRHGTPKIDQHDRGAALGAFFEHKVAWIRIAMHFSRHEQAVKEGREQDPGDAVSVVVGPPGDIVERDSFLPLLHQNSARRKLGEYAGNDQPRNIDLIAKLFLADGLVPVIQFPVHIFL